MTARSQRCPPNPGIATPSPCSSIPLRHPAAARGTGKASEWFLSEKPSSWLPFLSGTLRRPYLRAAAFGVTGTAGPRGTRGGISGGRLRGHSGSGAGMCNPPVLPGAAAASTTHISALCPHHHHHGSWSSLGLPHGSVALLLDKLEHARRSWLTWRDGRGMSGAHAPSETSLRFFFICLVLYSSQRPSPCYTPSSCVRVLRAQGPACQSPPCPPK